VLTNRVSTLFGVAALLGVFGVAQLNGAVAAMALPLCVYLLVGAVEPRRQALMLTVERELSSEIITSNSHCVVTLRVTNVGAEAAVVELSDSLPFGLSVISGFTRVVGEIPAGESATLSYVVGGPRGEYYFDEAWATSLRRFALQDNRLALSSVVRLRIDPQRESLRVSEIRPLRTRGFYGPISARVPGAGTNFLGLREYQPADQLKAINWRVSARMSARLPSLKRATISAQHGRADDRAESMLNGDTFYSNVYEQQRIADIVVVLDARASVNIVNNFGSLFDHSLYAAGAISESFLGAGHRVGLLVYGAGIDTVFPGYGKSQRLRIVSALGRAKTGAHEIFRDLQNLPSRLLPPGSQIVFVGPCGQGDIVPLIQLRSRGHAVLVVSPDSVRGDSNGRGAGPTGVSDRWRSSRVSGRLRDVDVAAQNLAESITKIERGLLHQKLQRDGVQIVDWNPLEPLDPVVYRALRVQRSIGIVRKAK
jgi:uncharacterized protein (DUF58 family)